MVLNKSKIKNALFEIVGCEDAQATTEYILLLTVSISIFMILKKMLSPAFQKMTEGLQARITQSFDPKGLHQFRVR